MSNTRSTAILIAVLAFFTVAILSYIAGCSPDTCCCRALLGAVAAYFVASWALQTILNIIYAALAAPNQNNNKQEQNADTDADSKRS